MTLTAALRSLHHPPSFPRYVHYPTHRHSRCVGMTSQAWILRSRFMARNSDQANSTCSVPIGNLVDTRGTSFEGNQKIRTKRIRFTDIDNSIDPALDNNQENQKAQVQFEFELSKPTQSSPRLSCLAQPLANFSRKISRNQFSCSPRPIAKYRNPNDLTVAGS